MVDKERIDHISNQEYLCPKTCAKHNTSFPHIYKPLESELYLSQCISESHGKEEVSISTASMDPEVPENRAEDGGD